MYKTAATLSRFICSCENDGAWPRFVRYNGELYDVPHLPLSLYNGTSGTLLALGLAAYCTSDHNLLCYVAERSEQILIAQQATENSSFYTGATGRAYVGLQIGQLVKSDSLLNRACELARNAAHRSVTRTSGPVDFINGTAGEILGINLCARFTEVDPDTISARAEEISRQAVAGPEGLGWFDKTRSWMPLCGLAHGGSGIALALNVATKVTGKKEFSEIAAEALKFERWALEYHQDYWPDYRLPPEEAQEEYFKTLPVSCQSHVRNPHRMDAWCHGSIGIALSRAGFYALLSDETVLGDLHIALKQSSNYLSQFHNKLGVSLCHGVPGWILASNILQAVYSCRAPQPSFHNSDYFAKIVEDLNRETPLADCSLFLGYSGVLVAALSCSCPRLFSELILPLPI